MKALKPFPYHPLAFSIFPVLALLSYNIREVNLNVLVRPLVISLSVAVLLMTILGWVLHSLPKAALITSFLLLLFFSYGHVYQFLEIHPVFGVSLGRHRYLMILYAGILLGGLAFLLIKVKPAVPTTRVLNLLSLLILVFPILQTTWFELNASKTAQASQGLSEALNLPNLAPQSSNRPDIYYIILDSYARADTLQRDFDFDDSSFIRQLKELGFYVAECGRSNYHYTLGSLTSSLNMSYLDTLQAALQKTGGSDIWGLIKHNVVRSQLEAIGYKTVAFETEYEWSRLSDADVFLGISKSNLEQLRLSPFETLLLRSSAGLLWTDMNTVTPKDVRASIFEGDHPQKNHILSQLFILQQLPGLATFPGPKFVFAHILIPHGPFVFAADGSILTDPGYYSGKSAAAINETYRKDGYTGEIAFINSQILKIAGTLIEKSKAPPVIIIQGDHGTMTETRLSILNAYYIPRQDGSSAENIGLYSEITPVNSFRVVFNDIFGADYDLLPDISYWEKAGVFREVPEWNPTCIQP